MNLEILKQKAKEHQNKIILFGILDAIFIILSGVVVVGVIAKIIIPAVVVVLSNFFPEYLGEVYYLISEITDTSYESISSALSTSNINVFGISLSIVFLLSFYVKFFVLFILIVVFSILLIINAINFVKEKRIIKEISKIN